MKKNYVFFIILPFLLCLSSCIDRHAIRRVHLYDASSYYESLQKSMPLTSKRIVTIWIHGTRLFSRTSFREVFNGQTGLRKAREIEDQHSLRMIADTLAYNYYDSFDLESFYFFGWSGKLCFASRLEAAQLLYAQLRQIILNYHHTYGERPYIRIITHSHGGNVALNLARVKTDSSVIVDELIMLACPVQAETKHFIHDPIFKQITALYSCLDMLQILDPQGFHNRHALCESSPFFSERRFPPCSKLMQAKIRFNKRALTHHEFLKPLFLKHLPIVMSELHCWYNEQPTDSLPSNCKRLLCLELKHDKGSQ